VRSSAPPARKSARTFTAATAGVRLSLRIGVPPGPHIAGSNGVAFELAGKPHAVTTALQAVRTGKSAAEHILALVTRLWGSFLCEIAVDQIISILYARNVDHIAKCFDDFNRRAIA
jgi:trehalose-6-phosphatase